MGEYHRRGGPHDGVALFRENFVAWDYPYPNIFASRWLRALCLPLVLVAPMRSEFVSDRTVIRAVLWPALRDAQMRTAARTLSQALVARVGLRVLMFAELCQRITTGKRLAKLI